MTNANVWKNAFGRWYLINANWKNKIKRKYELYYISLFSVD